jgi:hypothetical protein
MGAKHKVDDGSYPLRSTSSYLHATHVILARANFTRRIFYYCPVTTVHLSCVFTLRVRKVGPSTIYNGILKECDG